MIFKPIDYKTQLRLVKGISGLFYFLVTIIFIFVPSVDLLLVAFAFLILFTNYDNRLRSYLEHKVIKEDLDVIKKRLKLKEDLDVIKKRLKRGY